MNHKIARQVEARRDPSLAAGATYVGTHFWHFSTGLLELRTGPEVDRAIDAHATKHSLVCGVHNGVNLDLRDVPFLDDTNA